MKPLFILFLFILPGFLKADIAVEGQVDRRIRIENLKDFPEYEFYILFQEYYYHEGYQPGDLIEVTLEDNKTFVTGGQGAASYLYARKKGESEGEWKSAVMVGGEDQVSDYSIQYLIDVIHINKIENGVIDFKVVKTKKVRKDQKEEDFVGWGSKGNPAKWNWYFWLIPVAAFIGLIAFLFNSRRMMAHA